MSAKKKSATLDFSKSLIISGRGGQIRTDDILLPKQALYQAELRPVTGCASCVEVASNQALLGVFDVCREMISAWHPSIRVFVYFAPNGEDCRILLGCFRFRDVAVFHIHLGQARPRKKVVGFESDCL